MENPNRSEIEAMAKMMNMINGFEDGNVDEVIAEHGIDMSPKGDIAAMRAILENVNNSLASLNESPVSDIDLDLELEEGVEKSSVGSTMQVKDNGNGTFKLAVGPIVIVDGCHSSSALDKLRAKIEQDGLYGDGTLALVDSIKKHTVESTIKESLRAEYAKAKSANNINLMESIKVKYRNSKRLVETLEKSIENF